MNDNPFDHHLDVFETDQNIGQRSGSTNVPLAGFEGGFINFGGVQQPVPVLATEFKKPTNAVNQSLDSSWILTPHPRYSQLPAIDPFNLYDYYGCSDKKYDQMVILNALKHVPTVYRTFLEVRFYYFSLTVLAVADDN